jgi:hypothetical protein
MKLIKYILLVVFTCACSKHGSNMTILEFNNFVNIPENGYIQELTFNKVKYSSKIELPQMIAINMLKADVIKKHELLDKVKQFNGKTNFVFTLSDSDGNSEIKKLIYNKEDYNALVSYANTALVDDFKLLLGTDTIPARIAHIESSNGIEPVVRISVGFSGLDSLKKDLTLIYNDRIFNNGPLKFYFTEEALTNLPKLKL